MEILLLSNRVEAFEAFHRDASRRGPTLFRAVDPLHDTQAVVTVRDREVLNRLTHTLLIRIVRTVDGEYRAIACPDEPTAVMDALMPWARVCYAEIKRHFQVRGDMALAQTVGGGWASVFNVRESLRWALILRHLARQIGDEACERKCEVFIGWAHLWNGNKGQSLGIFSEQLQAALEVGDDINCNRCVAALSHARHNPLFARDEGDIALPADVIECRPEELVDGAIQRRNIGKEVIAHADPNRGVIDDDVFVGGADVDRRWQSSIASPQ